MALTALQRTTRNALIVRQYKSGARMAKLAERHGLSFSQVRRIIKAAGAQYAQHLLPGRQPVRNQNMASAYRRGATIAELAAEHKLSIRRVWDILRAQGIVLTPEQRKARRRASLERMAAQGRRPGPTPLAIPEQDRAFYRRMRSYFGAARARELVGLAA